MFKILWVSLACLLVAVNSLQCLDRDYNQVDWWICLKTPSSYKAQYGHFCMSSLDKQKGLTGYESMLTDPKTHLTNTLDEVNALSSNLLKLFSWNDETPTKTSSSVSSLETKKEKHKGNNRALTQRGFWHTTRSYQRDSSCSFPFRSSRALARTSKSTTLSPVTVSFEASFKDFGLKWISLWPKLLLRFFQRK